jgi:hypothetical protein
MSVMRKSKDRSGGQYGPTEAPRPRQQNHRQNSGGQPNAGIDIRPTISQ